MLSPPVFPALSRRGFVAGAGALAAAGPARAAAPKSLGAHAAEADLAFGASIASVIAQDADYAQLYKDETRLVTTDYALKFGSLRPTRETFDFSGADYLIGFAQQNNLGVRGHTMIWNENIPAWVKALSSAETRRLFDGHIDAVAGHCAGKIQSWDVVNEPFWPAHGKMGGFRDGPWFAAFGEAYVERALRRTAAADPAARLCVNEAHCENDNEWGRGIRPRLLRLIDTLQERGAPLHAVGLQCHLRPDEPHDDVFFRRYLEQIAERGLDIYITELDVDDQSFTADIGQRDEAVARRYETFLREVLQVRAVKQVILWELSDKYSWYRTSFARPPGSQRLPRPLPFDDAMRRKPAWEGIARAFQSRGG